MEEMHTPRARRNAAFDMLVFDHGLWQGWRNLDEIAPGVWRSSQPDPAMLRRMARDGLKAVLNLRRPTLYGWNLLERRPAASRTGAGRFPRPPRVCCRRAESILALDTIFARLPRPFLMHCKSGADRAGFATALYLLLHTDANRKRCAGSSRGAISMCGVAATGILHALLTAYEADRAGTGIGFRDWVATRYDRRRSARAITATGRRGFWSTGCCGGNERCLTARGRWPMSRGRRSAGGWADERGT